MASRFVAEAGNFALEVVDLRRHGVPILLGFLIAGVIFVEVDAQLLDGVLDEGFNSHGQFVLVQREFVLLAGEGIAF